MKFADRACDTTATTGTGDISLSGVAPDGYQSLAAIPVGDEFEYCIRARTGAEWEIGTGKRTASTTLQRMTVLSGSNGTSKVSFSSGTKDVFCIVSASRMAKLLAQDDPPATSIPDLSQFKLAGVQSGVAKNIALDLLLEEVGVSSASLPAAGALTGADIITLTQGGVDKQTNLSALASFIASQNGGSQPASTVSGVTVNPSTASVAGGGSQTFTATVAGTNSPSQAVTWTASAGTISASGVFTAPTATGSAQTITITATSSQDGTKSGTATVTVAAAASTVSSVAVSPSTANVAGGGTQQFTATVSGTNSPAQSVTWTASAGSINSSGLFTAPAATGSAQTITITATSTQDASKSGTATVTVAAVAAGPTDYNITPYSGNGIKTSVTFASFTGTGSRRYKPVGASSGYTTLNNYWNVDTPTPTKVYAGFGTSPTSRPDIITSSNNQSPNMLNGLTPMTKGSGSAWQFVNNLWVDQVDGATTVGPFYCWIQPEDASGNLGLAECINAANPLYVTGA